MSDNLLLFFGLVASLAARPRQAPRCFAALGGWAIQNLSDLLPDNWE